MSKYCPECGEELVEGARFCRNCGYDIENRTSKRSYEVPVVEKNHTAAIAVGYILSLLVPLFGIITGIYLITRKSPKAKKHGKYIIAVAVVIVFISALMQMSLVYM